MIHTRRVYCRTYLDRPVFKQLSVILVEYVRVFCDWSKTEFSLTQAGALSSHWQTDGKADRWIQLGVFRWLLIRLAVELTLQYNTICTRWVKNGPILHFRTNPVHWQDLHRVDRRTKFGRRAFSVASATWPATPSDCRFNFPYIVHAVVHFADSTSKFQVAGHSAITHAVVCKLKVDR